MSEEYRYIEWRYPYNVVEYWSKTDKWMKRKQINVNDIHVIERDVLDMTACMKWLLKYFKNIDEDTFDHDYYEIEEDRKRILEVYKKFKPREYKIFIKNNPKVLDYEKYEKKPKETKKVDN